MQQDHAESTFALRRDSDAYSPTVLWITVCHHCDIILNASASQMEGT